MKKVFFEEKFQIGNRWIGPGHPCFVIAEAGSNHNGDFAQALRLIDVALEAGADAVKFQTFTADRLYPRIDKPADYLQDMGIDKSVFQVIREMEMPREWIPQLAEYSAAKGILFLSTPFDEESADELEPYLPAYKISSYEMTHAPLIDHVARKGKPMMISTGGATTAEIDEALELLSQTGNKALCLLQCTAKYPAPLNSLNLNVLETFRSRWNIPVGLSDHSLEPDLAPLLAIAKGASVIEKHFTLSKRLPGPDHTYALEPDQLKRMVGLIRDAETCLGSGVKQPHPVEAELSNYRRGVFTVKSVAPGESFSISNLAILRRSGMAETNLRPQDISRVLGKRATRTLQQYTLLRESDVDV